MQYQKQKLERDLQVINTRLVELSDVEKMHQQNFDTLGDNICGLQNQKHQLEQFAYRFKNSNKKYLKVKDVAEDHVNRLLTEEETLLELALKAVIEALRMNPDRHAIIYNIEYDSDDNIFDSSTTPSAMPSSPIPQNCYYKEYHEGLLELAKGFLKILLKSASK